MCIVLFPQVSVADKQKNVIDQLEKFEQKNISSLEPWEVAHLFGLTKGVMGTYYASEAGFEDNIADACKNHYAPLGPSDKVPNSIISVVVALVIYDFVCLTIC